MDCISSLLSFINRSPSPYHTVQQAAAFLQQAGFQALSLHKPWKLAPGQAYYVNLYGTSLVAFRLGKAPRAHLRLAAAHTDFPNLRVKMKPEIHDSGAVKLNAEVYGGLIREAWLDRPLGIAGVAALRGKSPFQPRLQLVDSKRPLVTIPRLAIHMNRNVNKGVELNPQQDLLPLFALDDGALGKDCFTAFIAQLCGAESKDLLSYELGLYPVEKGCKLGLHEEFVSSPRLDNLTSVFACLSGLSQSKNADGLNVIALFDNEEVGSRTKQGAASFSLPLLLQRLYHALGYRDDDFYADLAAAFLLSLDVAHAVHPNRPEKADPTNQPLLGRGLALKMASSQSYAGDATAIATIRALCEDQKIPYQTFMNRSDSPGGSTLGSLLSANLPVRTMDVGIPILAMHSCRELMGSADQTGLNELVTAFFQAL